MKPKKQFQISKPSKDFDKMYRMVINQAAAQAERQEQKQFFDIIQRKIIIYKEKKNEDSEYKPIHQNRNSSVKINSQNMKQKIVRKPDIDKIEKNIGNRAKLIFTRKGDKYERQQNRYSPEYQNKSESILPYISQMNFETKIKVNSLPKRASLELRPKKQRYSNAISHRKTKTIVHKKQKEEQIIFNGWEQEELDQQQTKQNFMDVFHTK